MKSTCLLGAIAGDIIGSLSERDQEILKKTALNMLEADKKMKSSNKLKTATAKS